MVKGKLYKLANLDKNKRNNCITSYNAGDSSGAGWLWTANYPLGHLSTFKDGIDTWYEALGPDGNIHRFTPSMRSTYFRSP